MVNFFSLRGGVRTPIFITTLFVGEEFNPAPVDIRSGKDE